MRKDMLKSLKMPEKESDEDAMLMLDEGEIEALDMPVEEMEDDAASSEVSALADISDEDLLAEFKARGLSIEDGAEADIEADLEEVPEDEEEIV